jgi:hypothetical protein
MQMIASAKSKRIQMTSISHDHTSTPSHETYDGRGST